jgi:PIN domain nuclease of toxin-antitoxin system
MSSLLLDTCAVLWVANGDAMAGDARAAMMRSTRHVSPISVWEIANLVRKQRVVLTMPVVAWFNRAVERINAALPSLSVEILAESCALPGAPPADPADRIVIATARAHDLTIVTRDRAILRYAQDGFVKALPC